MGNTRESERVFQQPDVIVVGSGVIGLACATMIARQGPRVLVVSSNEPGAASPASAGIVAPSVGLFGHARTLAVAARDMYPEYLDDLATRSGVQVPLDHGLLAIALTADEATSLRAMVREDSEWIDAGTLRKLEPALAPAEGAVLHHRDGAVDPVSLLTALRAEAVRNDGIAFRSDRVAKLRPARAQPKLELADGTRLSSPIIVLAAGAWIGTITGLPRAIPVEPVRGQILEFAGRPLRHIVTASSGYVVPRRDRSLVGSTMEQVGFDSRATEDGASAVVSIARQISKELASFRVVGHWAGLRPVTPDLLPIVGPDPDHPGLFYACGHSKNGVLLAPLTARIITELITTGTTSFDVAAYAPGRFAETGR